MNIYSFQFIVVMDVCSFQFNCRDGHSSFQLSLQSLQRLSCNFSLVYNHRRLSCNSNLAYSHRRLSFSLVYSHRRLSCSLVYSHRRLSSFFISFSFLFSLQSWQTVFILHFVFVSIQFIVLADCLRSSFRFVSIKFIVVIDVYLFSLSSWWTFISSVYRRDRRLTIQFIVVMDICHSFIVRRSF